MAETEHLPSHADLFIHTPLYEAIQLSSLDSQSKDNYLTYVKVPPETIDAYCIECQKTGTFAGNQVAMQAALERGPQDLPHLIVTEFRCARNNKHRMYFFFRIDEYGITKTGQYPSIADLSTQEIKHYRSVLTDDKFKELSRAVGLISHGVGIGAFVYLRRIFESLIEEAGTQAEKDDPTWNKENFMAARIEEKIQLLRNYLPSFLVENKHLYSILSKGIHSLSEEECLKYFNVVHLGIEMILDEKLEKQNREEKQKRAKSAISEVHQKLKEDSQPS
jgi:hypothetical protein